jgi:Na+-transporting NADH:ubiquinone oxidoreductase subunit NqrC
MKDDNKLSVVTGDFSKDDKARSERYKALRDMRESLQEEYQMECLAIQAHRTRVKYLALVKEGFTEAQALELCK